MGFHLPIRNTHRHGGNAFPKLLQPVLRPLTEGVEVALKRLNSLLLCRCTRLGPRRLGAANDGRDRQRLLEALGREGAGVSAGALNIEHYQTEAAKFGDSSGEHEHDGEDAHGWDRRHPAVPGRLLVLRTSFVTSQGSPYARFRKALDQGNVIAAVLAPPNLNTLDLSRR